MCVYATVALSNASAAAVASTPTACFTVTIASTALAVNDTLPLISTALFVAAANTPTANSGWKKSVKRNSLNYDFLRF